MKQFLIWIILSLAAKHSRSQFCSFADELPDTVKCASYTNINSESLDTSKGIFCREMLNFFCNRKLSSDTQFDNMIKKVVCTRPHPSVNTRSRLGSVLRLKMLFKYCKGGIKRGSIIG